MITELLASVLLLITQFFDDETIHQDTFFQEFCSKLSEICRLAIEQKLETDELIGLLTPLLDQLTKNFSIIPSFRKRVQRILIETFSSLPLTFSLQKKDIDYQFVVEQKTISLSIQGSIMYETNAPTDCMTFLERVVRLYPTVSTPVIQFWILSMGIFEDIFSTFGDALRLVYLPTTVPKEHPRPFRFIEGYREFYKFDIFDQIFAILNRSVPNLRLTLNDFQEILELLKKLQITHDKQTFENYSSDRSMSLLFVSALIGFQIRDMLSDEEDRQKITDVLNIKEVEMLQRNVRAEVEMYYLSRVSLDFFKNQRANIEVDFSYLKIVMITDLKENPSQFLMAHDALQEFYNELNS